MFLTHYKIILRFTGVILAMGILIVVGSFVVGSNHG